MSLVGFSARNHRQQVGKRGPNPKVDDRGTPLSVFEPLAGRFGGFTIDVAAAEHNTKCDRFYTIADNGLEQSWAGECVWCNPPYSDIGPWVAKAHKEAERAELIVMLLPANRTEQGWWQDHVEPYRDRGPEFRTEFIRGRTRFHAPVCDRCHLPIIEEPHDELVDGVHVEFHPDCCPCQENDQ